MFGKIHSVETRRKISENHADVSGKNNPNYGKPRSDETKQKLSELRKGKFTGEDNPFYGKRHTEEAKQKMNDDKADKYLNMLDVTIQNAVLATTQTYVDSLKKQGKFDVDAQKEAFKLTYDAVMKVLTPAAVKYITMAIGDLETYVTNNIEADVKLSKNV
jgi:hypothetical protein